MPNFEIEFESREHELQFIGRILKKLMGAIDGPVMLLKPDHTIVEANTALLVFLGLSREEVVGKSCHLVSHQSPEPCSGPADDCPLREVLITKASAHALHQHHSGAGTCYYDVMAYPIKDQDGNVELILEIWRDISATLEREVEKKASRIKQDLTQLVHEDKMIALGKLVASAAHEINNPLSAIHTFCKVMLRMIGKSGGNLSAEELMEMEEYLKLMAHESKRCGDIVSNLLSFSRHRKMNRQLIDINEIIRKTLLLLGHKMDLQKIKPRVDLLTDLPHMVGDLNQVQQVIMNLVFNAMEAMPRGGDLEVITCFDPRMETVAIKVSDTGCGISPENKSKVFEPFFSTRTNSAGVGLGLAVVYGIVKEHNGSIVFESVPGKGTTFTASFPGVRPGMEA
ncbi:MAG: ATP-binding protein [Syntrophobacteraceae bacterium]